jgi:deoxyribonuclease-2
MFMSNATQQWQLSTLNINDTQSLPAKTLDKLYTTDFAANDQGIGYVLYNDQADTFTIIKGHTKGVLLFNNRSAVWIVHSIPHYPPVAADKLYKINPAQCVYGQHLLCMSFDFEQLETIGKQLLFNFPQVYDYYIPEGLKASRSKELEPLLSVIKGDHVTEAPWASAAELVTSGGQRMLSFSKFTEFEDDLYSGLVAPSLKSNLYTETWSNGAGTMDSNCSKDIAYHVVNIEQIKLTVLDLGFTVHNDHSKWAVTNADDLKWRGEEDDVRVACIGDINRQVDQLKRGGGTVCFLDNEQVWSQYHGLVVDVQGCKNKKKKRGKMTVKKFKQGNEHVVLLN